MFLMQKVHMQKMPKLGQTDPTNSSFDIFANELFASNFGIPHSSFDIFGVFGKARIGRSLLCSDMFLRLPTK